MGHDDDFEDEGFKKSEKKEEENYYNMIKAYDAGFQQFLSKATKIVSIFLKDKKTPQELARSVLKFLKISVSILGEDKLDGEQGIAKNIIDQLFSQKENNHVKKHKLLVRKIITKLIRKLGVASVTRIMPEMHRAIITYIEREKRKKTNKREKERILELMGKGIDSSKDKPMREDGDESSEDDSSDEEDNQLKLTKKEKAEAEEEDSEDDIQT